MQDAHELLGTLMDGIKDETKKLQEYHSSLQCLVTEEFQQDLPHTQTLPTSTTPTPGTSLKFQGLTPTKLSLLSKAEQTEYMMYQSTKVSGIDDQDLQAALMASMGETGRPEVTGTTGLQASHELPDPEKIVNLPCTPRKRSQSLLGALDSLRRP